MTIFKQIALLVALAFLLLTSVILVNDFRRSGSFLQGQLQTSAQDMATTLGIAISNLQDSNDQATIEVLFNSVFDSGYYTHIELVSIDKQIIHQKSRQLELENVPEWFLKLVPLEPAKGQTQIMKGWTQLGELTLSLHPGFAYTGLYNTLVSTLKWLVVLLIAAILALWLVLHYLLSPLQRVREQADAIHRNQFVIQTKLPRTTELKSVVDAINRMVTKVQGVFNEQEKTLARYQELLYRDKLTGLGNRLYMLDHLQRSLSEESSFHGCLGMIKLVNLDQLRDHHGYEISDQLIKKIASILNESKSGVNCDNAARLSDDEFAFLISADEESANRFIEDIYQTFKDSNDLQNVLSEVYLVAAISTLNTGTNLGSLLSEIDYSLTQAINEGSYSIITNRSNEFSLPEGKMQWRAWLDDVILSDRLFLVGQLAIDRSEEKIQRELFIRTRNQQDQVVPASAFMPMASSLGMALEIDKAVFRLVRENIKIGRAVPLALNLSVTFFERADAHEEFNQLLLECQKNGSQLCIEASHHVLLHHPIMCSQISDRVRRHGHQFGIDNLDLGQSLQLLKSAKFEYVKINAETLKQMSSKEMSAGYRALKTMTDTLDIRIIAVGVDSKELFDELQSLGIEVMQGNYLYEPENI